MVAEENRYLECYHDMQPTIDAKPMLIKGLVAERSMIGALCLHVIMQPAKGAAMPLFKCTSDLDYNLNDTRWDYMSIDTRITAGLMYFTYFQMQAIASFLILWIFRTLVLALK